MTPEPLPAQPTEPGPTPPPRVSVVVPCRNEADTIGRCVSSLLSTTYPKDRLEVLVVDGMSDDGTRAALQAMAASEPCLRVLDNPRRVTPAALNIGVRAATGHIVIRVDAHATFPRDYISKCVQALGERGADDVGGRWEVMPRHDTAVGRGIARALSHPLGVGGSYYRLRLDGPRWVDTVPWFACRRETLERVGPFNEALVRGQDMEFNARLRALGGRILLVPDIVSTYYALSTLRAFARHNWRNGRWTLLPVLHSRHPAVSPRHLVPLAAVVVAAALALAAPAFHAAAWVLALLAATYASSCVAAGVTAAIRARDPPLAFTMPMALAVLHTAYGLGSLEGLARVVASPRFWRRARAAPAFR